MLKWLIVRARLALLILVVGVSCSRQQSQESNTAVVLEIGERQYSVQDFARYLMRRSQPSNELPASADLREQLLNDFADEQLLLTEAERNRISVTTADLDSLTRERRSAQAGRALAGDELREAAIVQKFIRTRIRPTLEVQLEEARAFFEKHREEFDTGERVTVREILVETAGGAERLAATLRTEARRFGELAVTYSRGASAAAGGKLGEFGRGELPEQFEKVVFNLRPGKISPVVRSSFGYHLFLVEHKKPGRRPQFSDVKEDVLQRLLVAKEREALRAELERLRASYGVRVYAANAQAASSLRPGAQ